MSVGISEDQSKRVKIQVDPEFEDVRMSDVECLTALNVNQPILQRFDYHTLGSVTLISSVTGTHAILTGTRVGEAHRR